MAVLIHTLEVNMHVIHLDHVSVNYGGRVIFRDLLWAIDDHSRVGLIGPNGAGKSSIFKLLSGELLPDAGRVTRMNSISLGYLPQEIALPGGITLLEAALDLPPDMAQAEAGLSAVELQLGDPEVYNNPDRLTRVLAKQEQLLVKWESLGGARYASTVREILARLGIREDQLDLKTEALSGGQKKLVALARLAVARPTILMLDEPDNHLDLQAKTALEEFIKSYPGGIIIVSHDRYLLDEVATEIVELEDGKLTFYKGNYSAYTTKRELHRLRQQQLYTAQQKEIARIEESIKRFEHWARIVVNERHIRQARSRRRMLDRMEANGEIIEAVRNQRVMSLELEGSRGSTKALELNKVTMGFDDQLLFVDVSFTLRHGERTGLVAANGSGKSVLMRLIRGEVEPLDGTIKVGPSNRIGYYAQEHQTLSSWLERTPLELIRDRWPHSEGDAVALLLKFAFSYSQTRQPIKTLSGGERSRLQLACIMLERPNLLLLDEPTNNLDIASSEVLEYALEDFEGALLIISHDRYFLDRMVDRVLVLEDGVLEPFEGGYTDMLAARHRVVA
jgi:ATP-binding cassette subfamily F protein 3